MLCPSSGRIFAIVFAHLSAFRALHAGPGGDRSHAISRHAQQEPPPAIRPKPSWSVRSSG